MTYSGHCLCGQVHYTIDAKPLGARTCWCRDCQYIASGSATINVLFPQDSVTFTGEVSTYNRTAQSGNTIEQGFCPKCGSQLYSKTLNIHGLPIRIRAGTLDNPEIMPPQATIWTSKAPSWATFDDKVPQYPEGIPAPPTATPV